MKTSSVPTVSDNKEWFLENKQELIPKYKNRFILIYNKSVVKISEDEFELLEYAQNNYENGFYCITRCNEPVTYKMAPLIWAIHANT